MGMARDVFGAVVDDGKRYHAASAMTAREFMELRAKIIAEAYRVLTENYKPPAPRPYAPEFAQKQKPRA